MNFRGRKHTVVLNKEVRTLLHISYYIVRFWTKRNRKFAGSLRGKKERKLPECGEIVLVWPPGLGSFIKGADHGGWPPALLAPPGSGLRADARSKLLSCTNTNRFFCYWVVNRRGKVVLSWRMDLMAKSAVRCRSTCLPCLQVEQCCLQACYQKDREPPKDEILLGCCFKYNNAGMHT